MSMNSLPSALEEPRQFSVPVPFDYHPDQWQALLACSETHVALGQRDNNRVYLYSLPAFNVDVLELEGLSHLESLEIYGKILLARDKDILYFYDLSTGKSIGVPPDDYWNATTSFPGTELVETEENGRLIREEWPKVPTLVICSADQTLQTYMMGRSFERSSHNIDTEEGEESATRVPVLTTSLRHRVKCQASLGRTAITGGYDATVRVWDLITGECRQVLMGHQGFVHDVCLDIIRIYSASGDSTVRIWDRCSGDCLHVLDWAVSNWPHCRLFLTPSYLMGTGSMAVSGRYETSVWDPGSGMLLYQIGYHNGDCLGPIQGKDHTIVTSKFDTDSGMVWLKIWNVKSGQELIRLRSIPSEILQFCSQDRFLMVLIKQNHKYTLKVWDFVENQLPSSEDDNLSSSERSREDNLERPTAEDPSRADDRKGSKGKDFIRRLLQTDEQEGNEMRQTQNLTDLVVHYSIPFPCLFPPTPMSTPSLPSASAWKEPRQFSIPGVPFDNAPDDERLLFACSATHVVLGQSHNTPSRFYVYSLPSFELDVLELREVSPMSIEIYGEILVVTEYIVRPGEGYPRRFYNLRSGESLGVVTGDHGQATVSLPCTEWVETEEEGRLVREKWPKYPTLVICFPEESLRMYRLHCSFERSTPIANTEPVQESDSMVPETTVALNHGGGYMHSSIGRTAVTAGEDATVRVWDIITEECRSISMGHRSSVTDVSLDKARVYSSSTDGTVRVWERYSGDCLHVLEWAPFETDTVTMDRMDVTASYLLCTVFRDVSRCYETLIWDSCSGRLMHQISSECESYLGPIRLGGKERTLVTREEDPSMNWLRIWDVKSGQALVHLPAGPCSLLSRFVCQDRFLVAGIPQGDKYVLKVWDFLDNNLPSSEDDILRNSEGLREDELGEPRTGGSSMTDDRKSSKGKNFIRRLFQTNEQEGNETRQNRALTDLGIHYSM
ncbi:hypothetical protein CVT26_001455 [Gymnopilus dilepis]|uniref:Uncharacterized protein n=1 Tax=Gymnopilus dilepis TaxID=231916 RepID=A0A409WBB9_9AGAR|nr:hypothetical protein CVT26_001455 [Gymnopilus dilepis]